MKYLIVFVCGLVLASGFPSHYPYPIHPGVGAIYKGPNSETIIKGPDGSVITSETEGGSVAVNGDKPGVILTSGHAPLQPAPVLVPVEAPIIAPVPLIAPSPVILKQNPIIVDEISVADPKIVEERVIVGHKVISVPKKVEDNTDLVGPSGTISTRGGDAVISGPSSITVKGDGVVSSIDKQPDVHLKSIEVKPVVAPAVIKTIQPIISEPRAILPIKRPIYTEIDPILSPVVHHSAVHPIINHAPAIIKTGPLYTESALSHSDITLLAEGPANFVPHYAPAYLKPVYRGPLY